MLSRLALLSASVRRAPRLVRNSSHHADEVIKITMNDVPIPRGNWQARYDELQRQNNIFLAISTVIFGASVYSYFATHEFVSCPDEPAERWYPLDRFKDGDGSSVI